MIPEERLLKVLRAPLVSEKATVVMEKNNTIVVKVAKDATKAEIKAAVNELFLDTGEATSAQVSTAVNSLDFLSDAEIVVELHKLFAATGAFKTKITTVMNELFRKTKEKVTETEVKAEAYKLCEIRKAPKTGIDNALDKLFSGVDNVNKTDFQKALLYKQIKTEKEIRKALEGLFSGAKFLTKSELKASIDKLFIIPTDTEIDTVVSELFETRNALKTETKAAMDELFSKAESKTKPGFRKVLTDLDRPTEKELKDLKSIRYTGLLKTKINAAIDKLFESKVKDVNTLLMKGKTKRRGQRVGQRSDWKKAYVTLKEGHRLDFINDAK